MERDEVRQVDVVAHRQERLDWDNKEIRASDARAEQKASILLGIAIGSLALTISLLTTLARGTPAFVVACAGAALLYLATSFLVLAVRPQVSGRSALRNVSWTRLRFASDSRAALDMVTSESDEERHLRIAELNRVLATRVWRKHRLIFFAVMAMLISLGMVAASAALHLMHNP